MALRVRRPRLLAGSAGQEVNDNLTLPGTDSQNATDLLEDKFPEEANGTNPIVFKAPEGKKLDQDPYAKAIDDTIDNLTKQKDLVQDTISPFSSEGADQLSKGGEIGYVAVNLKPESPPSSPRTRRTTSSAAADPARRPVSRLPSAATSVRRSPRRTPKPPRRSA